MHFLAGLAGLGIAFLTLYWLYLGDKWRKEEARDAYRPVLEYLESAMYGVPLRQLAHVAECAQDSVSLMLENAVHNGLVQKIIQPANGSEVPEYVITQAGIAWLREGEALASEQAASPPQTPS